MQLKPPSFKLEKSYDVAFSSSGKLLTTTSPIQVNIWDVSTRKKLNSVRALKNPSHVVFSPDETSLAIKNTVGEICIVDVETGDVWLRLREKVDDEGCAPLFTPDGKYLFDGSWDGLLYVWDVSSGQSVHTQEWPEHMIVSVDHSAAAEVYAIGVQPKTGTPDYSGETAFIKFTKWPVDTGYQHQISLPRANLWTVRLSPDASSIAIVTGEGYRSDVLEIVDAVTGKVVSSFCSDQFMGKSDIAWSPDGKLIAWPGDNQVKIFSAPDLRELTSLEKQYASTVEFSPDGNLLAIGAWRDGVVLCKEQLGVE